MEALSYDTALSVSGLRPFLKVMWTGGGLGGEVGEGKGSTLFLKQTIRPRFGRPSLSREVNRDVSCPPLCKHGET